MKLLYCNFDTIITGLYRQLNNNKHVKQLFDCNKLYHHITIPTANNDDNKFKKRKTFIFLLVKFWTKHHWLQEIQ